MKIKKLLAVVLCVLMLVSLCACGKMTVERLVADMAKAIADVNSFAGTMNTGVEMSVSIMGQSMDMSMTVDADVSYYDNVSYNKGTVTTAMTGQDDIVVDTEVYTVNEGDTVTSYSLTEGVWSKLEMEKPELDVGIDTVKMLIDPENMGKIVLEEELDTYNGKEVYVLTIADCNYPELTEDYINSQMGSIFGDMDMSEVDLSGIVMQVTLKVYKDTKLPAVLVIDFGDSMTNVMDSMMDAMMDAMMGALSGSVEGIDLSAIFEQLEMSFEVPGAISTMTFDKYNIEPITVPEEALAAEPILEEGASFFDSIFGSVMGDTGTTEDVTGDDAAGTEDNTSAAVNAQAIVYSDDGLCSLALGEVAGCTLMPEYSDEYTAYYEYSTNTEYISYMYYIITTAGYPAETLVADSVDGYVEYLNSFAISDLKVSDVQTATVNGYKVAYVTFDYFLDYPSQDILALITIDSSYAIAFETYTMTDGEIDTMATLETAVAAIIVG